MQPPGTWSDDTQLSLAMMDSFKRSKGYDLCDIRKAHVEAFEGRWGQMVGWGGSTRNACKRMKDGLFNSAEPMGAGNGPVIKIAPLALYAVYQTSLHQVGRFTNSFNASLFKKCKEVSLLTHGNLMCIVATYCQARMIIRAMQDEIPLHCSQIVKLFFQDAEYAQSRILPNAHNLVDRLAEILTEENFDKETGVISKQICTEQSSYIYNSYALVAYCVCKYLPYRNFQYAVAQTANAGADADSNASMVGAIAGALLGYRQVPKAWIIGIRQRALLEKQIVSFVNSLTKL